MLSRTLISLLLPKRAARWRGVRPSQWRQRGGAVSTPESRAVTISSTTASCTAERPCEAAETARCRAVRPKLSTSSLAPPAMSVLTASTSYRRTASCRRVSCGRARLLPACRRAIGDVCGERAKDGEHFEYGWVTEVALPADTRRRGNFPWSTARSLPSFSHARSCRRRRARRRREASHAALPPSVERSDPSLRAVPQTI